MSGRQGQAEELLFRSRITGERIIAVARLILLIPLTLFAVFILVRKASEVGSLKPILEPAFLVEFGSILAVLIYSLWLLRLLGRRSYKDYITYVSPFIDITLLNLIVYANAAFPRVSLVYTGAPTFLYFIFIALAVLRNSPSSVVFTGVYVAVSYAGLSLYASIAIGLLREGGNVFTGPYGTSIIVDWDDEIIKPLVFLIVTVLLRYVAKRFNQMVTEQNRVAIERENLKEVFIQNVKAVSQSLLASGKTLANAYRDFSGGIVKLVDSSKRIEEQTTQEYRVVESTTGTIGTMIGSIDAVAKNIRSQAQLIAETSAAIEEMGGSIRTITNTSQKASGIARGLLSAADDGGTAMTEMNSAVQEAETQGRKVEEIVALISEMADRTNLLSMNASIEAAHAGKSGAGFAVIAGEIRKLAETSGASAKEIGVILQDIAQRIANIGALAQKANGKLQSILGGAKESTNINSVIQTAMEEELRTVGDMMNSVKGLRTITDDVKNASQAQSEGSSGLMDSVGTLKAQADSVSSLIGNQMTECRSIEELSQALNTVVTENARVIERLESLLKSM